jgi:hypothetical protein
MSDWTITRNDDGSVDEIVAHGVDLHLEQMDKGSWSLNVYIPDNVDTLIEASVTSKKRVSVWAERGNDVYPIPTDGGKVTPPSVDKSLIGDIQRGPDETPEVTHTFADGAEFIKFADDEIKP